MSQPIISIIVAIAQNGAIGRDNQLLYHLPNDLKHFKSITSGHTLIMGRKTFDSLPFGALPNRRNIVITHNQNWSAPKCEVVHSLADAIATVAGEDEVFIIGGATLYQQALTLVKRLYITWIEDEPDADTFFPIIDLSKWQESYREDHKKDDTHTVPYSFVNYERL